MQYSTAATSQLVFACTAATSRFHRRRLCSKGEHESNNVLVDSGNRLSGSISVAQPHTQSAMGEVLNGSGVKAATKLDPNTLHAPSISRSYELVDEWMHYPCAFR